MRLLLTIAVGLAFWGTAQARPHIVAFFTDDLGVLDTAVYGSQDVRTPNVERLAAAGMTFDRAFVASPACAPSRAALLTGLMPARNGAEANHTYPKPGTKYLTANLHDLNYEIAAFGKVIARTRTSRSTVSTTTPSPELTSRPMSKRILKLDPTTGHFACLSEIGGRTSPGRRTTSTRRRGSTYRPISSTRPRRGSIAPGTTPTSPGSIRNSDG